VKKVIQGIVVLIVVLFVSILVIGINKKLQNQKAVAETIARYPVFSFMTLDKRIYNSTDAKDGPILIVHFHPECEHCQYEISEILKSKIPILCSGVILVSSANPDSIRSFLSLFNFTDYSSVIPLLDTSYEFEEIFGSGIIPSSYIYNRKLNLVKVLHGEVKSETILKYLQQNE
jgi:hypothetical protein